MARKYTGKVTEKIVERKQKNGSIYVYIRKSWYDPDSKNTKSKYELQGRKNPLTGEIEDTRPKAKQSATSAARTPVTVQPKANAMIDIVHHFADASGITQEVMQALPKDKGRAEKILTLAWYDFATDGRTWTRAIRWTSDYLPLLPYKHGGISKDMYTDLFNYIGENEGIMWSIFEKRAEKFGEGELMVWDSTVFECWVKDVHDATQGPTKDGLVRVVYKVIYFYSATAKKLICFVKIRGHIADSTTIPYAISIVKKLNLKKPEILQDNGYTDDHTIGELLHQDLHFISRLVPNTKWIQESLEAHRQELIDGTGETRFLHCDPEFSGVRCKIKHTFSYVRKYKSTSKGLESGATDTIEAYVNIFIYYSSYKKGTDDRDFRAQYAAVREDILNGSQLDDESKTFRDTYMDVIYRASKIVDIHPNQKAIANHFKHHGFLILIANHEKDMEKALMKFRTREKIEERIKGHKSHTGGDTSKTGSDSFLEGELLVEFLAECMRESMLSKLDNLTMTLGVPNGESAHDSSENMKIQLKLKKWIRKNSIANILDAYDTTNIEDVQSNSKSSKLIEPTTKRDRLFLQLLGIDGWGAP